MSTPPPDSSVSPISFHASADFDHLLNVAREHLRKLAGEIWTDHNTHDPGITILEVLCFAIADLSYRTSFDIKDLLAAYPGDKQLPIDLPLADVALPNHPWTVQDLRKVLLDLAHPDEREKLLLRNAWPMVSSTSEEDLYVVEPGKLVGHLSFNSPVPPKTVANSGQQEISLSDTRVNTPVKPSISITEAATRPVAQEVPLPGDDAKEVPQKALPTTTPATEGASAEEVVQDSKLKTATTEASTAMNTRVSAVLGATNANPALAPVQVPPDTLPGGGTPSLPDQARLVLNGLYGIQLEFEEDRTRPEYWLADLNRNSFEATVLVSGQAHRLSALLPYWDQIDWSLRNVDLSQAVIGFDLLPDTSRPYFIAVDKLNYDDHFYDYYAEVAVDQQVLGVYVNILDPVRGSITDGVHTYAYQARWLDWNELANGMKMDYSTVSYQLLGIDFVGIDAGDAVYDIRATFKSNLPDNKEYPLLLRIEFDGGLTLPDHFTVISALQQEFAGLYQARVGLENAVRAELLDHQSDLYAHYLSKLQAVFRLVYGPDGVWEYLGEYRNLCEDFTVFSASRVQEIALFGKVLIHPGFNPNQVLGEVFYLIDQFLNPLVRFQTLGEMSGRGYTFAEIFTGPLLRHGFIEDGDLEVLNRRSVIYTSDLISIIMDVEGVAAVEGFSISSYIDNRLMGRKVTNCLSLTYADVYRPRLSVDKSALEVWSEKAPETTDDAYILEWYRHRLEELKAGQLPEMPAYQLALPTGRNRHTGHYKSVQHDFPLVYGIGPYGLPADADSDRKARARQLKGFLLPFEQILANYLKQIADLPELFSFNATVDTTYPHRPLYEIPDVEGLFRPFLQSGTTWDSFKSDLDNAYRTVLRENESREEWLSRRNRFLDHLLGRFSENFSRYAMQLFNQHKHLLDQPDFAQMQAYQVSRHAEMERLIEDKITFAHDLPQVTSQRSRAFNYLITDQPGSGWGSDNISGYKRRICRLLGIRNVAHDFIFHQPDPQDPSLIIDLEGLHVVEHILLRPRTSAAAVFALENQHDGTAYFMYDADRDPYSFCLTVVLPSNAGRFRDAPFRKFAEMLIREETPAHIRLEFRWMGGKCGRRFEESYASWLKLSHEVSPWVFQGRNASELSLLPENAGLADYFKAQNSLVNALQMTCGLRLSVFDSAQQPILPLQGLIRFHASSKDIYFLEVSEPGGKLNLMFRRSSLSPWEEVAGLDPVDQTWLRADQLGGNKGEGLTAGFYGEGQYMLVYSLDNASERLNIEVLPELEKVRLNLIKGEEYLLSQPGIPVKINVSELRDYLILASPLLGTLKVSVAGGPYQPVPFSPARKNEWRMSDFHREFGGTALSLRYELQDHFDQLELVFVEQLVELDIRVTEVGDPKDELLANPEGRIVLLPGQSKVRLDFNPKGGRMQILQESEQLAEVLAELNAAEWFEMDVLDFVGSSRENLLRVEYSYLGQLVSVLLEYQVRKEPEVPEMVLYASGEPFFELPAAIDPSDSTVVWTFGLRPLGGIVYFYRMLKGERELIGREAVTEKNQNQRLEVGELWKVYGNGDFVAEYVTPGGFASVGFALQMEEAATLRFSSPFVIRQLPEQEPLQQTDDEYVLKYDFRREDQAFEFRFQDGAGNLKILEGGRDFLVRRSPERFIFRSSDLPHGIYQAEFYPEEGDDLEFSFSVRNLDPRFKLVAVEETAANEFALSPEPLNMGGRTYIWRLDDRYVSRAKCPVLQLDFSLSEEIEVQLAVFIDGESGIFEMMVNPEMLRALGNEK